MLSSYTCLKCNIENIQLSETHMHVQYIKCWLYKGFNKLDKIDKKSRFFFCNL